MFLPISAPTLPFASFLSAPVPCLTQSLLLTPTVLHPPPPSCPFPRPPVPPPTPSHSPLFSSICPYLSPRPLAFVPSPPSASLPLPHHLLLLTPSLLPLLSRTPPLPLRRLTSTPAPSPTLLAPPLPASRTPSISAFLPTLLPLRLSCLLTLLVTIPLSQRPSVSASSLDAQPPRPTHLCLSCPRPSPNTLLSRSVSQALLSLAKLTLSISGQFPALFQEFGIFLAISE